MVGILANYNMIVKNIYNLVLQVFTSTSASIGNLAATEDGKKQFKVFNAMQLMCFWIFRVMHYSIICKCKYIYEKLWAGKWKLWFGTATVLVLIIDFSSNRDDEYSQPFQNVQWSVRTGTVSSIDHVDHQYCSVGVSCEKNFGITGVILGNCNIQTADSDMVWSVSDL